MRRTVRLKLGVLVSGSGTNLQSILDAVQQGRLDAEVRVVVSNRPDAYALERATRAGVETRVLDHREFESREAFDRTLVQLLRTAQVEWVALAGFMRVLTPEFLQAFPGRVLNIHPSLLPAFPGVNGPRQAFEYGVKVAGCTVHFVDEGVDAGPIIAQRAVPVLEDDDAESLRKRILEQEHALYVEVLQALSEERISIQPSSGGRTRVRIAPPSRRQ